MPENDVKRKLTDSGSPGKLTTTDKDKTGAPVAIQVIVDFLFKDGLFFIAIENISEQPAYQVSIEWKPAFRGLGGTQATSELPLFKKIEFLAPYKVIETFLDTSQAYFQRNEPTHLEAVIQHQDSKGSPVRHRIRHNLEIYRDITYRKLDNPI